MMKSVRIVFFDSDAVTLNAEIAKLEEEGYEFSITIINGLLFEGHKEKEIHEHE